MKFLFSKFFRFVKPITEAQGIQQKWYAEAKTMTFGKLFLFLFKLMFMYRHDYGTIVHAVVAGALVVANVIYKSEQGSITSFQASAVMWRFIREWTGKKGLLRLLEYDNMLYPQYFIEFEKTITNETWDYLQEMAMENLEKFDEAEADKRVIKHWQSIVNGDIPFGYKIYED
jgi:hypothetical protein